MPIVAVLFGWPAVLVSLGLALGGIAALRARVVLAGAVMACPVSFYLSLTPRFQWVAPPAAVLLFLAAQSVAQKQRGLAVCLVIPYAALMLFIAYLAATATTG